MAVGASAALAVGFAVWTRQLVAWAERHYPALGQLVSTDGIRLHYLSQGAGQPVVLIHGDGGSVYDWTLSIFDRVARDYHAVAFDRPGFGYSQRPRDGASPVVQARLLHTAAQALRLERPVLVAHSRGVSIALAYALDYPDDIAGVVDLGGLAFFGKAWAPWSTRLVAVPVLGPLVAHTIAVPLLGRRAVEAGLEAVFAPEGPPPPAYLRAYAAMILRPTAMQALADDQLHSTQPMQTVMARYAELRVPLIILNGTADNSTPIEQSRRLHRIVPGSRLVELPGAGHEIMFFHPDQVMQAIRLVVQHAARA